MHVKTGEVSAENSIVKIGETGNQVIEDEKTYILRATCAPGEVLINISLEIPISLLPDCHYTKYQRDRIFIT